MQLYEQGHETADPTIIVSNSCYILALFATNLRRKDLDDQFVSCYKVSRLYNFSMYMELLMGFLMTTKGEIQEAEQKMMRAIHLAKKRQNNVLEYEEIIYEFYGKLVEEEQPRRKPRSYHRVPRRAI